MNWTLILGAVCVGVVAIAALQYRATRGQYRPLSTHQPQRRESNTPELGMEAIDMAEIQRTQRRNESLERTNKIWTRQGDATNGVDVNVAALPDDETYARRFYTAFIKNKD